MAWHRAIIWTNDDLIYWLIYATLGLDELTIHKMITASVDVYVNKELELELVAIHMEIGHQ